MRAETERSGKGGEESDLLGLDGSVRTLVFILGTNGGTEGLKPGREQKGEIGFSWSVQDYHGLGFLSHLIPSSFFL